MTPRSFWKIIIKILGIWIIIDSIFVVYQFLVSLILVTSDDSAQMVAVIAAVMFLVLFTYFLIIRYCIFKTDWLIDKLKLDKNFTEEKFEINIHRATVLKIAIIVIGGLIFIDSVPVLFKQLIVYFQESALTSQFRGDSASTLIIFHFLKSLLGYYLMTNSRFIVNLIERQRKKPENTEEEEEKEEID